MPEILPQVARPAPAWAAILAQAEAGSCPVPPLTQVQPTLALADAYEIQEVNTRRRLAAGERLVGRKVGLTSRPMQVQLGVDEPDFGVIFDRMVVPAGGTVHLRDLIAPRAEAEIAVRLGADLAGPDVSVAQARAAVAEVLLAIEIIDSRIADWRIGLVDTVADNASSARVVPGPVVPAGAELLAALPDEELEFRVDGETVATGRGAEVLGDPLEAVAWLARTLHRFGTGLGAGELVLAGAVHASVALRPDTVLEVRSASLTAVRVHVTSDKEEPCT